MTAFTKRPQDQTETGGNRPDWIAKSPRQIGRKERLERVGAAWNRAEDDGICLRLHGTQIVTEDIYLYPYEGGDTE